MSKQLFITLIILISSYVKAGDISDSQETTHEETGYEFSQKIIDSLINGNSFCVPLPNGSNSFEDLFAVHNKLMEQAIANRSFEIRNLQTESDDTKKAKMEEAVSLCRTNRPNVFTELRQMQNFPNAILLKDLNQDGKFVIIMPEERFVIPAECRQKKFFIDLEFNLSSHINECAFLDLTNRIARIFFDRAIADILAQLFPIDVIPDHVCGPIKKELKHVYTPKLDQFPVVAHPIIYPVPYSNLAYKAKLNSKTVFVRLVGYRLRRGFPIGYRLSRGFPIYKECVFQFVKPNHEIDAFVPCDIP